MVADQLLQPSKPFAMLAAQCMCFAACMVNCAAAMMVQPADLALEGDRCQQAVKGALPVCCDDDEAVPQIVCVTNLALRRVRRVDQQCPKCSSVQ